MSTVKRILALLLALCMLLGVGALAEQTAETPATEEVIEESTAEPAPVLNESDVVAVLNGKNITWGDCQAIYNSLVETYGSYYDLTTAEDANLFNAAALSQYITQKLLEIKGDELGLSYLTDEEIAQMKATAESDWNEAIQSYISYFYPELDSTDEAAVAEANAAAETYYGDLGYTLESLGDMYVENEKLNRVSDYMVKDAVITDEDVQTYYQSLVDADKELYENDLAAYCEYNDYVKMMEYYSSYYGSDYDMDYAWYRPEGYRAVKHILIPVDEELMTAYTDLAARLEEQQEESAAATEETAAAGEASTEETAAAEEPVTQEMVDAAYNAIMESKKAITDEIYKKIEEGVDFDDLIATYGVDADGNASDPGMTSEPYKTDGYEVCEYSSDYVKPFVDAAMSIAEIGGISEPYLSDYGIHILKYLKDVPAGAIELSDEERQAMYEQMLSEKQNELYNALYTEWLNAAALEYTGLIPNIEDVQ